LAFGYLLSIAQTIEPEFLKSVFRLKKRKDPVWGFFAYPPKRYISP